MIRSTKIVIGALALSVCAVVQAGPLAHRETHQQARIGQGLSSGQITAHGAERIEQSEARIQHDRARDIAAHNGKLTQAERHRLNHRLDNASRTIHRDKHNGFAQPGVQPAGSRHSRPHRY